MAKHLNLAENYIYIYHTGQFVILPQYPDNISDRMDASFSSTTPLSRSAPIYSYAGSGPRTVQVNLSLHRDLIQQLNDEVKGRTNSNDEDYIDYIDFLINQLQTIVIPKYDASSKLVDPPLVAVRFGNQIFIKGVIAGSISTTYRGPILQTSLINPSKNNKYGIVELSFIVSEIEPFGADEISQIGSFRQINTTLVRNIYTASSGSITGKVQNIVGR